MKLSEVHTCILPEEADPTNDVSSASQDGREKLKQKEVTEEDVCPICQEEFLEKPEPLTYCKLV